MSPTRIVAASVTAAAILTCGCGERPDWERAATLQSLAIDRVELPEEWRDARLVPPGPAQTLRLGHADGQILRLGLLAAEPSDPYTRVDVYAGDRRIARMKSFEENQWINSRVVIPPSRAGDPIALVCASASGIWLGPCEFVSDTPELPNILIFLIDTLRQDHLSCYGYPRRTSPNLDDFARDAIRFTNAMSTSSWTRPSVASMLTGTYPNTHGSQDEWDIVRSDVPRLAERLRDAGYETHGIMGNLNCLPMSGFGITFFRYLDAKSRMFGTTTDDSIVDAAIKTVEFVNGRPWFLYVHVMGPHGPYTPPSPYHSLFQTPHAERDERTDMIDAYDGEIAFTDAQFGRLIDTLHRLGQYDNSLILVLADHGEEFWDHGGTDHGTTLYEELLRIPFLVKLPRSARGGTTVDSLVELVDIAPTLCDVLGIEPDPRYEGRSFSAALRGNSIEERIGYASLNYRGQSLRAARTTALKYIHDVGADTRVWFDLAQDPRESLPILSPTPEMESLAAYAQMRAFQGVEGLHLLIAVPHLESHLVTGRITGAELGRFELRYPEALRRCDRGPNFINFELKMGLQPIAHLVVDTPADALVQIELTCDGAPFPTPEFRLGRDQQPAGPGPIAVASISAPPDVEHTLERPKMGVRAYCWYVAPPDTMTQADLDAHTRETLRALGYL